MEHMCDAVGSCASKMERVEPQFFIFLSQVHSSRPWERLLAFFAQHCKEDLEVFGIVIFHCFKFEKKMRSDENGRVNE